MPNTITALKVFLIGDVDELERAIGSLSATWEIDGPTKCKVALPAAEKFTDGWVVDFQIELIGRDSDKLQQELLDAFKDSSLAYCMMQNVRVLQRDEKALEKIKNGLAKASRTQ
jgi:hypothetical protein